MDITVKSDKKFIFVEDLEAWAKEQRLFEPGDEVELIEAISEIETHDSLEFDLDNLGLLRTAVRPVPDGSGGGGGIPGRQWPPADGRPDGRTLVRRAQAGVAGGTHQRHHH